MAVDLPCFAAFPLLDASRMARSRLRRYYDGYLDIARKHGAGFVMETPTWRANPDWAQPSSVTRRSNSTPSTAPRWRSPRRFARPPSADGITAVVSGCIGPRGDGYDPADAMTPERGRALPLGPDRHLRRRPRRPGHRDHDDQRRRSDRHRAGGLGGGHSGGDLVHRRDRRPAADGPAAARARSIRWMARPIRAQPTSWSTARIRPISLRHWTHDGAWRHGSLGLRANASTRSHAELDEATELDEGDPADLGARHAALRERLPAVRGARRLLRHRRAARGGDVSRRWRPNRLPPDVCPRRHRRLAGPDRRGGGGRAVRRAGRIRRRRPSVRAGVGDQAAGRACRAGRDRGGRRRTRHPGGPARLDGSTPAGARLGAGRCTTTEVHGRAGHAPHLLQLRFRGCWPRRSSRQSGIEFDALPRRGGVRAARHDVVATCRAGAQAAGYGGDVDGGRPGRVRRRPAAAGDRSRRRCTPRPRRCSFPGWTGCCPGSGCSGPTTGGWASRSATASRRTGPARRTRPRTFGHFGQSGTFIWVDPVADLALVVLTDRDFGDWAHPLWPALSDGVLREFGSTLAQQVPHKAQ